MAWATKLLEKVVHMPEYTDPSLFYTTGDVVIDGEDLVWSDSYFRVFVEPRYSRALYKELNNIDAFVPWPKKTEQETTDEPGM